MKKTTAMLLVLLLAVSGLSGALAERAQYANTKAVVEALDDKGIIYTVKGLDEKKHELLSIDYSHSDYDMTVLMFFTEDNESIHLFVWNFLTVDDSAALLNAVNSLNFDYRFTRVYLDPSDNTISLQADLIVREGADVAAVGMEALNYMTNFSEVVYNALSPYAK